MYIKVSVCLKQNSLKSSLETRLTNVYGSESTLRDKLLLVTETTCVASGYVHFYTRDLVSSLPSISEELRALSNSVYLYSKYNIYNSVLIFF